MLNVKKHRLKVRASIRTTVRHASLLEFLDKQFKIIMINMLKSSIEKVDNMQELMGDTSREKEILKRIK